MRMVMFVRGDVSRDSRVLREARSAAAAGHTVTIVDQPAGATTALSMPTLPVGISVVHIPRPERTYLPLTLLRRPWRVAARGVAVARGRGPAARRAAGLGAAVALLPWVVVRGVWNGLVRVLGRSGRLTWADYVFDWRTGILPWCEAAVRAAPPADLHHGNDLDALPAAAAAARRDGCAYVYDSHEVFMAWGRHASQIAPIRAVMARWERRLAQGAAAVITVNDECADELARRLRVPRPVVVRNCSPRWTPASPARDRLREATGLPAGTDIVLCHGGFQAGRGLEETALAMREPGLETAHLVFLGYGHSFLDPIMADPAIAGRVHRLEAVPPDELLDWIATADVDVAVFRAVDLNHVLSTPNKLFEALAAGVPVVSSDTAARRRIVLDNPDGPLGVVCADTPAAIAAALREVLGASPSMRLDLRRRCRLAAAERWNWEHESARLLAAYDSASAASRRRR